MKIIDNAFRNFFKSIFLLNFILYLNIKLDKKFIFYKYNKKKLMNY